MEERERVLGREDGVGERQLEVRERVRERDVREGK